MRPVITTIDELTPAWLTDALGTAGINATVECLAFEAVGTGQMAESYRVTPQYAPGSVAAPPTLVVKVAGRGETSRVGGAVGAYPNEVRFYTVLADTVAIRVPDCFYGALGEDNTTFVLLLEDLAPARQGDQLGGCTIEEAKAASANLAALHGPRWCDSSLFDVDGLDRVQPDGVAFLAELYRGATDQFVDRYRARIDEADRATLLETTDALGGWLLGRAERFSLLHGDYRLDNLLFPPADPAGVGAVDWQTVSIGLPGRDLAYFCGNSLTVEVRRRHESEVVDAYHAALVTYGVAGHSVEECWGDYCYGHLQGPLVTILGAMFATRTDRGDDMFMAMSSRACAAIRDLGTLDLM